MKHRAIASAVALVLFSFASTGSRAQDTNSTVSSNETLAGISVNGKSMSDVEPVQVVGDTIALPRERWESFRVTVPDTITDEIINADALGVTVTFDASKQLYMLSVPSARLPSQQLGSGRELHTDLSEGPKGLMIGYDVSSYHSDQWRTSVAHDVRTNVWGGNAFYSAQFNTDAEGSDYQRSLTTWSKDIFSKSVVVQVGDVFNTPRNASLNGVVNIGGIRVGTDRSLRSDNLYPVPMLGGVADTRSTAELLVNSQRNQQAELRPGPYQFANLNINGGLNDIALVVRDEFGRETLTTRSVYIIPNSLRQGASEWEFQAGKLRHGSLGNNYDEFVASGFYSRGLNDRWTISGSAQVAEGKSNIMLGNLFNLGRMGALSVDVAKGGNGMAYTASYERRSRNWAVQASHTQMDDDYWQVSDLRDQLFRAKSLTSAGFALYRPGVTGSINYTKVQYDGRDPNEVLSARAQWRVSTKDELSFFASRNLTSKDTMAMVSWRHQWGQVTAGTVTANNTNRGNILNAALRSRTSVAGQTVNWSATANQNPNGNTTYLQARTRFSKIELDADTSSGVYSQTRIGARGGLWLGEGGVALTARPYGSYALVNVGQPHSVVRVGGQRLKSNRSGVAVISNVQSLHRTAVTVDGTTLPFDVQLASSSQYFVAPRNGGAKVTFVAISNTMREYRLVRHGVPIENGRFLQTCDETVAIAPGGAFVLAKPSEGASVEAVTETGRCTATLPAISSSIFDVFSIECKEVIK